MAGSVIFWTAKNKKEAKKIGKRLLLEKKVACINIFPPVDSLFVWKGKIEEQKEVKVFLKTTREKVEEVISFLQKESSYEISEVLEISIERGNPSYLEWMEESLS